MSTLSVDRSPLSIDAQTSLHEVITDLLQTNHSYALVVSAGQLVGVVTYAEVAIAANQGLEFDHTCVEQIAKPLPPLVSQPPHPLPPEIQTLLPVPAGTYWPLMDATRNLIGILTEQGFYSLEPQLPTPEILLQKQEERLRVALEGARMGTWDWDLINGVMFWSEGQEQLYGLPPGGFDGQFETFLSMIHPEDSNATLQALQTAIQRCQRYRVEFRIIRPDGTLRWLSSRGKVFAQGNQPMRLAGVTLDITEHKHAEAELHRQNHRERIIGEIAQRIHQSLDLDHILDQTVNAVQQFTGADRVIIVQCCPDISGKVIKEVCDPQYPAMMDWTIRDPWSVDEKYVTHYKSGRGLAVNNIHAQTLHPDQLDFLSFFHITAEVIVPLLQEETLWGLLVVHQCDRPRTWLTADVRLLQNLATQVGIAIQQAKLHNELKEANEQLKKIAFLDGLTQVPNRRRFEHYFQQEWRRLAREQNDLSLIMCDIDYFKKFNDVYGHLAGDSCLRQVARILSRVVKRPADLVARYGGEEFAVILPGTNCTGAEKIAEDMRSAVQNRRIPHQGSDVGGFVTLSLGVASCIPSAKTHPEELIRRADAALYEAKRAGRDLVVIAP